MEHLYHHFHFWTHSRDVDSENSSLLFVIHQFTKSDYPNGKDIQANRAWPDIGS